MAVNLNTRASTTTLHDSPTRTTPSQTAALATDPAKREAYIEQANKKFLAAQELAKTDPEAGMQAMKELVKKWQTVMRSNDWDSTDQSFKSELSKLIEQGLDFVQANEDIPTLSEVQSNPESAARYLKSKKKELENIEKNWESDPDFYGQKLVEHYASMAPLLEPETFAQLDPETAADVLKHMERVSALGEKMLAGTTTEV